MKTTTTKKPPFELVMERSIAAPRERVYEAWTRPEQVTRWFAPRPYQLIVKSMDFRPGGSFRMAMRAPDGSEHAFSGFYREVAPPSRLVWSGELSGGPKDQMTTVVDFSERGKETKVHVRQTFHVMTPEAEQATKGAKQGWTMTLDQLAAFCSGGTQSDKVEKSIELKAPISTVWQALTDYRQFGEWFRVKLDNPFQAGQPAHGHITNPGYEHIEWNCTVRKMEPEKLFSFTWHPYAIDPKKDYSHETPTVVEFKLRKLKSGTQLTVTEIGFDKLPEERRAEAFQMHDGGWTAQMKNIESFVAGRA